MDKNFVNIDNLLRNKLEGGEEKERAGAWQNMQSLLDKEMPKNKPMNWFYARRSASILALIVLLSIAGFGGYELTTNASNNTSNVSLLNQEMHNSTANDVNPNAPIGNTSAIAVSYPLTNVPNITKQEYGNIIANSRNTSTFRINQIKNKNIVAQTSTKVNTSKSIALNNSSKTNNDKEIKLSKISKEINKSKESPSIASAVVPVKNTNNITNQNNNTSPLTSKNSNILSGSLTSIDKQNTNLRQKNRAGKIGLKHNIKSNSIIRVDEQNNLIANHNLSKKTPNQFTAKDQLNKKEVKYVSKLSKSTSSAINKNIVSGNLISKTATSKRKNENDLSIKNSSASSIPKSISNKLSNKALSSSLSVDINNKVKSINNKLVASKNNNTISETATENNTTTNKLAKTENTSTIDDKKKINSMERIVLNKHLISASNGKALFNFDTIAKSKLMEIVATFGSQELVMNPDNNLASANKNTSNKESTENNVAKENLAASAPALKEIPEKKTTNLVVNKSLGSKLLENMNAAFNDIKYNPKPLSFSPGLIAGINGTFFGPSQFYGFQFGFTGDLNFGDYLSIGTELKYVQRMNTAYQMNDDYYIYEAANGGGYQKSKIDYSFSFSSIHSFEIPLIFKYNINNITIMAGENNEYSFAIKTGAAPLPDTKFTPIKVNTIGNDNKPTLNSKDFGDRFGLGYLFGAVYRMSPGIAIDFRMVQTLWDNANSSGAKSVSTSLYKSPSLQLSIRYKFGAKKTGAGENTDIYKVN